MEIQIASCSTIKKFKKSSFWILIKHSKNYKTYLFGNLLMYEQGLKNRKGFNFELRNQ